MRLRLVLLAALAALVAAAPASAAPWPPADGPGHLFVHFGEEHWNDDDSDLTLPKVVAEAIRYRPALVTMSGDKDNDGTVEQLSRWKEIMSAFDGAGIPYFPGIGNHDRQSPPGVLPGNAGVLPPGVRGSLAPYKEVFKDRPYPFGDAAPYGDPQLAPRERPANDPAGASSHYYVDYGNVRIVFLDNSCWSLTDCDADQSPPLSADGVPTQLAYLEAKGREASQAGKLVFVVMHIPTRDPRDQSYITLTSFNHVMQKGFSADNANFEQIAERAGVDAVLLGHIKGQWQYKGVGDIPYYIDGGAGGELYTEGPVGTDHGYWHGFRLLRVDGDSLQTDVVPIFAPGSIKISGPDALARGELGRFEATGAQPFKVARGVGALELRDPDPVPRDTGLLGLLEGVVADGGGLIFLPFLLLLAAGLAMRVNVPRRRLAGALPALALLGVGAVAVAQQSVPTSTPKSSLPNPARIWTSDNQFVLAPERSASEDPRRDPKTQTQDGAFQARCPGQARVTISSGFEESAKFVNVPSAPGRIVRRIQLRGRTARVRLAQPAEVLMRVRRGKRVVRTLRHACVTSGALGVRWDGRVRRKGKLRKARPGRYRLQVRVSSDRKPVVRRHAVRIRRS
jgi:Calcineurin-like phosphoesterase